MKRTLSIAIIGVLIMGFVLPVYAQDTDSTTINDGGSASVNTSIGGGGATATDSDTDSTTIHDGGSTTVVITHDGSNSTSKTGSDNTDTDRTQTIKANDEVKLIYTRSDNVNAEGLVVEKKIFEDAQKVVYSATMTAPNVTVMNGLQMTKTTISKLATLSEDLTIVADTTFSNTKTRQGRIYLKPSEVKLSEDKFNLGVWTEANKTTRMKEFFNKWFNNEIAVIQIDQTDLGTKSTHIAAKIDLTKLDPKTLIFYTYDKGSNTYNLIDNPNYYIDGNNYIHFYTAQGGNIIVTDKALTKR